MRLSFSANSSPGCHKPFAPRDVSGELRLVHGALVPQAAILAGHLYEHERRDVMPQPPLHHASSASASTKIWRLAGIRSLLGGGVLYAPDRTSSASYAASADSCIRRAASARLHTICSRALISRFSESSQLNSSPPEETL